MDYFNLYIYRLKKWSNEVRLVAADQNKTLLSALLVGRASEIGRSGYDVSRVKPGLKAGTCLYPLYHTAVAERGMAEGDGKNRVGSGRTSLRHLYTRETQRGGGARAA